MVNVFINLLKRFTAIYYIRIIGKNDVLRNVLQLYADRLYIEGTTRVLKLIPEELHKIRTSFKTLTSKKVAK